MSSVVRVGLAIAIVGLAACGRPDDAVDIVAAADEVNATMTDANMAMGNGAGAMMAEQPTAPELNVAAPANAVPAEPAETAPKASASAKPAPAKPELAEPKAADPKAPDPSCPPEHRAAGHC